MNQKSVAFSTIILLILLSVTAATAADDIKARFNQRWPVIEELKNKGIVGENNSGYLQYVGQAREKEDVVTAENEDRKTVYAAIAKQQGATLELVGKRRALQISQEAKAGQWLQDDAGKWYQKK